MVGQVTSGDYGYAVARSIAYAYMPVNMGGGAVAVAVDGDWIAPAVLYDPKGCANPCLRSVARA